MYYIVIDYGEEIWKPLTCFGIRNGYLISNYGDIKNTKTNRDVVSTLDLNTGYIRTTLYLKNGTRKSFLLHRLVAMMFVPGYDESIGRIYVNHIDSDRSHCFYKNLEWVTASENIKHSYVSGLNDIKRHFIKGVNVKYDDKFIEPIINYLECGKTASEICNILNIPENQEKSVKDLIHRIKTRKLIRFNEIIESKNIPHTNRQNSLSDDEVEEICELISLGYYTEDIIEILGIDKKNRRKYIKKICDIKKKRTFKHITNNYIFPTNVYGQKKKYSDELIIQICEMLSKNIRPIDIVNDILSDKPHKTSLGLVYDIKSRRLRTDISDKYEW